MPWNRQYFNNENTDNPVKVWVRVDESGDPVIEDGRAEIRYEDDSNAKVYNAHPGNLSESNTEESDSSLQFLDDRYLHTRVASEKLPQELQDVDPPSEQGIEIYSDGSAIKQKGQEEGPAGLGVVLRSPDHYKEIRQFIGEASNQVAELAAAYVGLEAIKKTDLSITLVTDSRYTQGMLVNDDWEAKANRKLVQKLRQRSNQIETLNVEWIEGHTGNPFNERADDLARKAVDENIES